MALTQEFLSELSYLPAESVLKLISKKDRPKGTFYLTIENEVRPSDLFCYLNARFGPPNGIQNFLRSDDSDNLIHWNWTLSHENGLVDINGTNFRTDVYFIGKFGVDVTDADEFASIIKGDFLKYGKQMSDCPKSLESWVEFVNPYQRLRRSIDQLVKQLEAIKVHEIVEPPENLSSGNEFVLEDFSKQWNDASDRLSRAFGLCFGIRAMLPVMAEAFVNLVLYVLMRSELKSDGRLRENAFKQHIDVRIKSLHLNCRGFKQAVDYSSPACGQYHSLVNERNDLLHGNIVIEKLRFNEVFFSGKIPVFKEYRSMWHRAFDVQRNSVGLDKVMDELRVVNNFIDYVLSCLDDQMRPNLEHVISSMELGFHEVDDRIGILFAEHLVDFRPGPQARHR